MSETDPKPLEFSQINAPEEIPELTNKEVCKDIIKLSFLILLNKSK